MFHLCFIFVSTIFCLCVIIEVKGKEGPAEEGWRGWRVEDGGRIRPFWRPADEGQERHGVWVVRDGV